MRIISGTLKGRKVPWLENQNLRPTTDFAKEGLFNILKNKIDFPSTIALDLFAGTGSLSYELASRGVKSTLAVDHNHTSIDFIQKQCMDLSISTISCVLKDVNDFLRNSSEKFSLILADPPFDFSLMDYELLHSLSIPRLHEGGILILEHSKKNSLSHLDYFESFRKYGAVGFSFFSIQV